MFVAQSPFKHKVNYFLVTIVRGRETGQLEQFVDEPHRTLYDRADFESRIVKQSDCKSPKNNFLSINNFLKLFFFKKFFKVIRDAMGVIFTIYGYHLRNTLGNVNSVDICSHSGQFLKELLVLHFG